MLPEGFSWCDNSDFSGWDRLPWVVENEREIELWLGETTAEQPSITCGYCQSEHRVDRRAGDRRSHIASAVRWFHAHDCATLQAAEQAAMVYDLTPMLTRAA